jgi:hypothetical protein
MAFVTAGLDLPEIVVGRRSSESVLPGKASELALSCAIVSFDDLVGAGEQGRGEINAERLRGFHVYDQLEACRPFDR